MGDEVQNLITFGPSQPLAVQKSREVRQIVAVGRMIPVAIQIGSRTVDQPIQLARLPTGLDLPLSETVAELEAHLANLMHLPPEPIPEIPETIEVEVDPAPQPEPGLENSTPEPEPLAEVIPIKRTLVVPPVLGRAAPHYGNHWNGCT